jgi:hypothetical protein
MLQHGRVVACACLRLHMFTRPWPKAASQQTLAAPSHHVSLRGTDAVPPPPHKTDAGSAEAARTARASLLVLFLEQDARHALRPALVGGKDDDVANLHVQRPAHASHVPTSMEW